MAKRRNLKKEKALRNQAYARKFRKRTNTGRYSRRRMDDRQEDNEDKSNTGAETAGAADV
jgi:hypothetical protein